MNRKRKQHAASLILLVGCFASTFAGDLEPPVPPGTPTMKPLHELEPRRPIYAEMLPLTITDAGSSWYLAESITTGGAGITVDADDVTIDLMGFTLEGGTGVGIHDVRTTYPYTRNVTVRNGTVKGWADQGIRLSRESTIVNVRAVYNDGTGIEVGHYSLVIGSIAEANFTHGIVAAGRTVVRDCVATDNSENGIWADSSVIVNCVADNNGRSGIRVDHSCLVTDNEVRGNSLLSTNDYAGIWVKGDTNRVEANLVAGNKNGLTIDGDFNVVVRNSAQINAIDNFRVGAGATANMIGAIQTSLTSAGPWDNLCIGTCP